MSKATIPVTVITTVDPVIRDSFIAGVLLDAPRVAAIQHSLDVASGTLRRIVIDHTGAIEDETIHIEHPCASCCLREDTIPTLERLAASGRWQGFVVAPPPSAEPLPITRALDHETSPQGRLHMLRFASSMCVVELETLQTDLLDDISCDDRGIQLTDDDERTVGEALAAQLEQADLIVTNGNNETASGLIDRLRGVSSMRIDGLHDVDAAFLFSVACDPANAEKRAHPVSARGDNDLIMSSNRHSNDMSWTLVLESTLPFDPERLYDSVEILSGDRVRARGIFWVANRPDSACLWDGTSGQLYIADLGDWRDVAPGHVAHTRLCYIGADSSLIASEKQKVLREAFEHALSTPEEMADGGLRWLGRRDVLSPWLGAREPLSP